MTTLKDNGNPASGLPGKFIEKAKEAAQSARNKTSDMMVSAVDTVQGKVNQVTDYATKQAISQLIGVVEVAVKEYEGKPLSKYPAILTASVSVATLVNLELQVTIPGKSEIDDPYQPDEV